MRLINTTSGAVHASELGRTLGHEHLIGSSEGIRAQWPHLFDEKLDIEESIEEVRRAQSFGVQTICDPGVVDIGRNVHVHIAVATATGVKFVIATGAYGIGFTFLSAFPAHRKQLADLFVHDIEVGVQDTDVKAGFIKVACDKPGMVRDIEHAHRAAAQASLRTGVPIMAHSNPNTHTGLDQMKIFLEEGVEPEKIQIAHCGDTADAEHIEEVLATGCFIGMDRYGIPTALPTEERNATVATLLERGYADRMILGQDSCVRMDGRTKEMKWEKAPNSNMTYIFEEVMPALELLGASTEQLDGMVGKNVHAWLAA
jgi:phosphotriesterase-related protein